MSSTILITWSELTRVTLTTILWVRDSSYPYLKTRKLYMLGDLSKVTQLEGGSDGIPTQDLPLRLPF